MSNYSPTLNDVIAFIRKSKGDCLTNWTDNQLAHLLLGSVLEGSFIYALDKEGGIEGICVGEREGNTVYVVGVIGNKQNLRDFFAWFKRMYPGDIVTGHRHKKLKEIKYERLLQKLS